MLISSPSFPLAKTTTTPASVARRVASATGSVGSNGPNPTPQELLTTRIPYFARFSSSQLNPSRAVKTERASPVPMPTRSAP